MPECDDGANNGDGLRALTYLRDERAIQLDLVEGEGLERVHRRVANAEVVKSDGDLHFFQLGDDPKSFGRVADDGGLGNFDFEIFEGQTGLKQNVVNTFGEIRIRKLYR